MPESQLPQLLHQLHHSPASRRYLAQYQSFSHRLSLESFNDRQLLLLWQRFQLPRRNWPKKSSDAETN